MLSSLLSRLLAVCLLPILFLTVIPSNLPLIADEANKALAPSPISAIKSNRSLPQVAVPTSKFSLPSNPSAADLEQTRLFTEPLFPVGGKPSNTDNAALASALVSFAPKRDRTALETFVQSNPNSPWTASVLTNLGMLEFQDGYFTAALADWQQAWTLGKDETESVGKLVIDRAVAELIKLYCRVGRSSEAEALLKEIKNRSFDGVTGNMIQDSLQATAMMDQQPKECFKCGPYALFSIVTKQHQGSLAKEKILEEFRTDKQGTSLSQIEALSSQLGLKMQMAKRTDATASLPLPAVVHWKLNHYAAVLKKQGDRYLVADPTFGHPASILADALGKESDGYFLIPSGSLPSGWSSVSQDEAKQVFGRGYTTSRDGNATKNNDKKGCNNPQGASSGMVAWTFHMMLASLHLEDNPVGYKPPLGPAVELLVGYDSREMNQTTNPINYSNFGPLWNFSWLSTITFESGTALVAMGTGGTEIYSNFNSTTMSYDPERDSNAILVEDSSNKYERDAKDGSKMIFGLSDPSGRFYLTQTVDPQGNALTYSYDSNFRLVGVTDAIGQVTTLTYGSNTVGNASFYLIAKVTDPFGRYAQFTYQSGQLQSITDAVGNVSSFVYGPNAAFSSGPNTNSFVKTLTTPYGSTNFTFTAIDNNTGYSLVAQEPNGAQQRVDAIPDLQAAAAYGPNAPSAAPANQFPATGYFYNGYLNYRDSLYWDRKAMQADPGDLASAHIYHFFHDATNADDVSEIIEAEKPALENWIWYAYQNQTENIYVTAGMLENITQMGRVLDNGATQYIQKSYNSLGNLLQITDPLGRSTDYSYYSNGVDLDTVQQVTGSGTSDLLATYTYNNLHEPLTLVDRAGEQTKWSYNTSGQITSFIDAKTEATTFNYTGGYLTSIQDPIPGNLDLTTIGYDSDGRVYSITTGEGYQLLYNYDNLDRTTKVTYPDGTYQQNTYTALDVTQYRDRQGRLTNYTFNGLDQMTSMTDANNYITSYGWCSCGALKSITDGDGHTTRWNQDLEGRTISKTYPDGGQEITTYDATGRVHSVTDAKGQVKLYQYNTDDSLASASYPGALNATSPVAFTYDPNYLRITGMQDGIGNTSYVYNPVTGGVSPGAGEVSQTTGPWANSTVAYSYDQLGRVASRSINGVAQTISYDPLARINQVVNALGTFNYTFENDSNRVSTMSVSNGQNVAYSYFGNTGDRRLMQIQNLSSGSNLSTFGYPTYNPEGSIATWNQVVGSSAQVSYTLGYDNTDELLSGSATGSSFGYSYDSAGNRLTETINGTTATATYNANNQLAEIVPAKTGDKTYQWDAENRLIAITYTGTGQQTKLSYDGLNRCAQIVELTNGVVQSTRRFLWCGTERCEERDAYDNVTKRFFDQGEQIYGANYYYFKDHLGSIWEMTDSTGKVRASYSYDLYGRRTKISGDLDADDGFAGLFYHQPSGLCQAIYRIYDPNTARWVSRERLSNAEMNQGPNLYTYCNNRPVTSIDPDGLQPVPPLGGDTPIESAEIADVEAELAADLGGGDASAPLTPAERDMAAKAFGNGAKNSIDQNALNKCPVSTLQKLALRAQNGIKKASDMLKNADNPQSKQAAQNAINAQQARANAVAQALNSK